MNHEFVWNIVQITHDEQLADPIGCGNGESERQ